MGKTSRKMACSPLLCRAWRRDTLGLEEVRVGLCLDLDQVRRLDNRLELAEYVSLDSIGYLELDA
jgi:ATP-dependent DNA ligase